MELKILSAQELLTSKKLSTYSIDTIHIEKFKKQLATKAKDKNADISHLQNQIDLLVYALYGLSEGEIGIVENKNQ